MDNITLSALFDRMRDLPEFVGLDLNDVNLVGNFGDSPLHVAATWGDVEAITTLIRSGANVNAHGEDNLTPLHLAASKGAVEAVDALLHFGADPQAVDSDGYRPIDLAISLRHNAVVELLKQSDNARPNGPGSH